MQANDPSVDEVLRATFRLVQRIKQTVHDDPVERAGIIILSRLREHHALRLSDLAGDLLLDVSTVSRHARALEDRGLVSRSEDPDDRRAVRLELAPAGERVLDAAWRRRHQWVARALHDWTDDERADLGAVLSRFAGALAQTAPAHSPPAPPTTAPPTTAAQTPAPPPPATSTSAPPSSAPPSSAPPSSAPPAPAAPAPSRSTVRPKDRPKTETPA